MAAVANEIERGNAVVIAGDCFAIDDAGARAQAGQRLDYQREAMREVVARTAVEPHSRAVLPSDNPKSVVLDLVQHWLPESSCSVTEILYRVYDFLTPRGAHDPLPFLPSRCGPI